MQVQQISFGVPELVFRNLARRSQPLNIRPAEYARRLFEAAYAARIADERREPVDDHTLDSQVRQVFLLAGAEPDQIADALGLPKERVHRILKAWRQAALELAGQQEETALRRGEAPAETAGTPPAAPETPAKDDDGYPREVIAKLWAEGRSGSEIGRAIGKTAGAFYVWSGKHRDICPKRKGE